MAETISQNLDVFINELHTEYEMWYAKSVRRNYKWWYLLQIISAISGLFFALASAIAVSGVLKECSSSTNDNPKIITLILVLLPALSSACANIIIRFRIYDLWMIREQGRIQFQKLHQEAIGKAASAKDDEERSKLYQDLVDRAEKIENEQQTRFFSIAGIDSSSNKVTTTTISGTTTTTGGDSSAKSGVSAADSETTTTINASTKTDEGTKQEK